MNTTVMIVEDAAFVRGMLKSVLTRNNYDVVAEASSGFEGMTYFNLYRPEITILDIIMTDMDGLSTLDEIVKDNPNAKIIMCSALGHIDLVLSCLLHGASGFVLKPFQEETLISNIENIVKSKLVFNKETIDKYSQYGKVKKIIEERNSLTQSAIDKLIMACTLDEPSNLEFLNNEL